jgi:hypothetical protein
VGSARADFAPVIGATCARFAEYFAHGGPVRARVRRLARIPRAPETALQFVKETQIDVNPLVVGTIKRARRGFCPSASRLDGIPEEYQLRVVIRFPPCCGRSSVQVFCVSGFVPLCAERW